MPVSARQTAAETSVAQASVAQARARYSIVASCFRWHRYTWRGGMEISQRWLQRCDTRPGAARLVEPVVKHNGLPVAHGAEAREDGAAHVHTRRVLDRLCTSRRAGPFSDTCISAHAPTWAAHLCVALDEDDVVDKAALKGWMVSSGDHCTLATKRKRSAPRTTA